MDIEKYKGLNFKAYILVQKLHTIQCRNRLSLEN